MKDAVHMLSRDLPLRCLSSATGDTWSPEPGGLSMLPPMTHPRISYLQTVHQRPTHNTAKLNWLALLCVSCNMTSVRMCFIVGYSPLRHGLYVFIQSFSLMEMEPSKQTPTETFKLCFESVDQFLYLLIRLEAKAWDSEDTLCPALPLTGCMFLGKARFHLWPFSSPLWCRYNNMSYQRLIKQDHIGGGSYEV